jgi:hypothetical protein
MMRRDSAGVWIVDQPYASLDAWERCAVGVEPAVVFGTAQGDSTYEFGDVVDVVPWSGDRVVVLDRQAREMRIFSREGDYLRTIGRDGEGPGEFRDPIDVVRIDGDSLLVWDWELQRATLFSPQGSVTGTIVPSPQPVNVGHQLLTTGGSFALLSTLGVSLGNSPAFQPESLRVFLYAEDGTLVDTLATLWNGSRAWVDQEVRFVGSPLFEAESHIAWGDDFVVVSGGTQEELEVRSGRWKLQGLIRWRDPGRTVLATELAVYREQAMARHVGTSWEPLMRKSYYDMPVSDRFPTVWGLTIGDDGTVWARQYRRPTWDQDEWLAFSSSGTGRCVASLPVGFRARHFGADLIWGTLSDEWDVQRVAAFAVQLP